MSEAPKITMPDAEASAWLLTGGRIYADQVKLSEAYAEESVAARKDGSRMVPLFTDAQLRAAYLAGMEAAAQIADGMDSPDHAPADVAAAIRRAAEGAIKP